MASNLSDVFGCNCGYPVNNEITILSRRCREESCCFFVRSAQLNFTAAFHELNWTKSVHSGTGGTPVRRGETGGTPVRLDLRETGETPVRLGSQSANGRDARSTFDFSQRAGSSFDTILNYGQALTRTYLAISPSQSLTWLSCTNTTAGHDLNLTRSSEAGSGDNRSAVVVRHLKIQELTTSS